MSRSLRAFSPVAWFMAIFMATALGLAKDIYIAQTTQGSGSGTNAASACAVAWFNTSGNWGAGTNQINPGDTVHLVGTVTSSLTFQGSGKPGNNITLLFEPGANMTAPYFSTSPIQLGSRSYLVVDGGVNGLIQCTGNGTTNANQVAVTAVTSTTTSGNITVKNLTIANMYIRTTGSADYTNCGGISFSGTSISNIVVCNCYMTWVHSGVYIGWKGPNNGNFQIYSNSVQWCNWGIAVGDGGANSVLNGLVVHDNRINGMTPFDDPNNDNHHDGLYAPWAENSGSYATNITVYNNIIGPDFGINLPATAAIFMSSQMGAGIWNALIYNNVLYSTSAYKTPACGFMYLWKVQGAGVYNNTMDAGGSSGPGVRINGGTNVIVINNIVSNAGLGMEDDTAVGSGGLLQCDYNDYYNNNGNMNYGGSSWISYSSWKALGFDAHSTTGDPKYVNAAGYNFNIQSSSAAKDAGTSESAYFTTDILGATRPQGSAWDIGAYEYLQGGAPSIAVIPGSLSYGSMIAGTSSNQTFIVQNTGTGILSGSASVATPFSIISGASYSLGAAQSQTVTVQYSPTIAGTNTQTVTFSGAAGATATVSGSALPSPPTNLRLISQ